MILKNKENAKIIFRFIFFFSIFFSAQVWAQNWTPPVVISSMTTLNDDTQVIGVDASGNAYAGWIDSSNAVLTARFDFSTQQWTETGAISLPTAENLQLAVTSDGKAIAVWRRVQGGYTKVQFATYQNGAWSFGATLDTTTPDTTDELFPKVGVNASGGAIAVWQVGGSPGNFIRAATYDFQSNTWGSFQNISSTGVNDRGFPSLAVNAAGNAVAIWEFIDTMNSTNKLEASQFQSGSWQPVDVVISSGSTALQELFPQVAIDGSGNAVSVWTQYDSVMNYSILSSTKTSSWSTPIAISTVGNNSTFPTQTPLASISLAPSGDGVAVWVYLDQSVPLSEIQARSYQGGAWSPTTTTLTAPTDFAFFSTVAVDNTGDAYALWTRQTLSNFFIDAAKFTRSSSTWGPVETISNLATNSALPRVATSSSGIFFGIWVGSDDFVNFNITAAHTFFLPPASISGKQKVNEFAVESELFNVIRWLPSVSPDVVFYRIYRNGRLIARVDSNVFKYEDHNRKKGVRYVYAVKSENSAGLLSPPIVVTIP
jgi:hypothetical protein